MNDTEKITDEFKANMEKAAEDANRLVNSDDVIRASTMALIGARQLYILFRKALSDRLSELGAHEMSEEILVQSATEESSKPLTAMAVLANLHNTVLPFAVDLLEKHQQEEEELDKADIEEAEKQRRETPVNLGFSFDSRKEPTLQKESSLILVSWRYLLDLVIDKAVTAAIAAKPEGRPLGVVRFSASATKKKTNVPGLVVLPRAVWLSCSNSRTSMKKLMTHVIDHDLGWLPDLLVVDDLPATFTGSWKGRPSELKAASAYENLRRWCNDAGTALLAGIAIEGEKLPDLMSESWEKLRMSPAAVLRPVTLYKEGEELFALIGKSCARFQVSENLVPGVPVLESS